MVSIIIYGSLILIGRSGVFFKAPGAPFGQRYPIARRRKRRRRCVVAMKTMINN